MHDRDTTLHKVAGEFDDFIVTDLYAAEGRKEHGHKKSILLGNGVAKLSENPRGHAKLKTDGVNVSASRTPARCDEHLVVLLIRCDFSDDCWQCFSAPITDRLASNFQDVYIRIKPCLGRYRKPINERLTNKALPHELTFYMKTASILFPNQWHGSTPS
jgi:hypothetical protein